MATPRQQPFQVMKMTMVNDTMKEVNDLTDEIYEGLADGISEDTIEAIDKLQVVLKNIKEELGEE